MLLPFFSGTTKDTAERPTLYFKNTLSGEKEVFTPVKDDFVRLYTCGPTVYDYVTVGNMRSFILADLIRRTLRYNGYKVKHIMNLTDIGHIVGDADAGDDKMVNAIKREGEEMNLEGLKRVADKYIEQFFKDMVALNIKHPHATPRPSECIPQQIALIKTLLEKEYAYQTSDGVYFDTARFKDYGKLGNLDLSGQQEGARVEENPEKRNPTDFSLWKKGEFGWDSPWGHGFPGWHIECSAMAMDHLGKSIDIHTGGEDLSRTHHNNEIAQSEAATGKQFVRYWIHNAFITLEDKRIGKSEGNAFGVKHISEKGYNPLSYRFWLLGGHYRSPMNFTWTALDASQTALKRLHRFFFEDLGDVAPTEPDEEKRRLFHQAINNDLDTPKAIAVLWEVVKDPDLVPAVKKATLLDMDKVLAIGLRRDDEKAHKASVVSLVEHKIPLADLPEEVRLLVIAREEMRESKDWDKADELRQEIAEKGFVVKDGSDGPEITKQ